MCEISQHCRPQNVNSQNWINQPYGDLSHVLVLVCTQIHVIIHHIIKKNTEKHKHYHYP